MCVCVCEKIRIRLADADERQAPWLTWTKAVHLFKWSPYSRGNCPFLFSPTSTGFVHLLPHSMYLLTVSLSSRRRFTPPLLLPPRFMKSSSSGETMLRTFACGLFLCSFSSSSLLLTFGTHHSSTTTMARLSPAASKRHGENEACVRRESFSGWPT